MKHLVIEDITKSCVNLQLYFVPDFLVELHFTNFEHLWVIFHCFFQYYVSYMDSNVFIETFRTTYPYQCPHSFPLSLYDVLVDESYSNFKESIKSFYGWVPTMRSKTQGYYRSSDIASLHKLIVYNSQHHGTNLKDCIIYIGINDSIETTDCDEEHDALCVYDIFKEPIFCKQNPQLCKCMDHNIGHICNIVEVDDCCSKLNDVSIRLLYSYRTNMIRIVIKDHSSLVQMEDDALIYCYTDVMEPNATAVWYKYLPESFVQIDFEGYLVYEITPRGRGSYWCTGYKYPDLEPIVSETISAGPSGFNEFVLNVTTKLFHSHIEFKAHYRIASYMKAEISYYNISIYFIDTELLSVEENCFKLIFHITVHESIVDAAEVYENLFNDLTCLSELKGITNYNLTHCDLCLNTTTILNDTEVNWPNTYVGQTAISVDEEFLKNDVILTRTCMGNFKYGAYWSDRINSMSASGIISALTEKLIEILSSHANASVLNKNLRNALSSTRERVPIDVYLIATILAKIAFSRQAFTVNTFITNVNSVMDFPEDDLSMAQRELNATDMLLYNLDIALTTSYDMKSEQIFEYTNDIITQVIDIRKTNVRGFAIYDINEEIVFRNLTNSIESVEDVDFENLKLAIFIPPKLFRQILEDLSWSEEIQLVTTVFANDVLFNCNCTEQSARFVGSIFVKDFFPSYFEEALQVIYENVLDYPEELHCGYWNYGFDQQNSVAIYGHWYKDDAARVKSSYILCEHWHMTHYALLVAAPVNKTINIITMIGCALSFAGIVAILITTLMSGEWRHVPGNQILVNFSISIMIQMIFLFISNFIDEQSDKYLCAFMGFSLHYIILCQFSWMMIISYLQYKKLVHSLMPQSKHIVLKCCVFAWLTPLLIVLLTCTNGVGVYLKNCYLSGNGLYVGLFLPVGLIIGVNMIFFGIIVYTLTCKNSSGHGTKMTLHKIKVFIILLFLMGFSWTFGLLAGLLESIILSYLFCIISTLQGLVIFVTFILCNKKSRRVWQNKLRKMKLFGDNFKQFNKDKESKSSYT